ncbi:hypothetical protein HYDPIDRAFT_104758 [Hydnomerulius pinastri MD-312]|nr:hypothetical protein HYDPIDRAFT_104758 [Hydnomerulius pinastri MD-312]
MLHVRGVHEVIYRKLDPTAFCVPALVSFLLPILVAFLLSCHILAFVFVLGIGDRTRGAIRSLETPLTSVSKPRIRSGADDAGGVL